ncbi:hypothetical protein [Pseudomonas sp.]|uniref:hypothetical protein n=1 Tax=Pseudomonas sp. TaxID=306 RepID=UPI00299DB2D8|nr:hypothetical protein [Pseudomonas sp.]MDX1366901.1 hypothetical protein [Pseudomonas sp.]
MPSSPSITVMTKCRLELEFKPVPMPVMPSSHSDTWLAFIGEKACGYSYQVTAKDVDRIQAFMIEHQTECLNDGHRNYTICGHALVGCRPEAIDPDQLKSHRRER